MRERGFTLIELLVVLVIIGVTVGLAVLTMADPRPAQLERESRRLVAVIGLAAEEAVLKSQILGIRFEPDGYSFALYTGNGWRQLEQDNVLRPYRLPEPLQLEVQVEGLNPAGSEENRDQPQVLLLNSGEMVPFTASVRHPDLDDYYLIEGQLDGKLTLDMHR